MLWAIARRTLRSDSDLVGLSTYTQTNPEIQLPCDCLPSVPEISLQAQSLAVALRSLTCSNSDTIGSPSRMQPGRC